MHSSSRSSCVKWKTPIPYWIYQYILYNSVMALYSIWITIVYTLVGYVLSSLTHFLLISIGLFYGIYTILLICFLALPSNSNHQSWKDRLINFLCCTNFSMLSLNFFGCTAQQTHSTFLSDVLVGMTISYLTIDLVLAIVCGVVWWQHEVYTGH